MYLRRDKKSCDQRKSQKKTKVWRKLLAARNALEANWNKGKVSLPPKRRKIAFILLSPSHQAIESSSATDFIKTLESFRDSINFPSSAKIKEKSLWGFHDCETKSGSPLKRLIGFQKHGIKLHEKALSKFCWKEFEALSSRMPMKWNCSMRLRWATNNCESIFSSSVSIMWNMSVCRDSSMLQKRIEWTKLNLFRLKILRFQLWNLHKERTKSFSICQCCCRRLSRVH